MAIGMTRLSLLEKAVLARFLNQEFQRLCTTNFDLDMIRVRSREFSGTGFLTEFEPTEANNLFEGHITDRTGSIGAKVGQEAVEAGFLFYIDEGRLTCLEGYTYQGTWPEDSDVFELYDIA
jgi:hypothetical protein